jgi:hypothetical protein
LEQKLHSKTLKPIVEYGWGAGMVEVFLISRGFLFWYEDFPVLVFVFREHFGRFNKKLVRLKELKHGTPTLQIFISKLWLQNGLY